LGIGLGCLKDKEGGVMMVWRFAFAIVLALHAWSGVLLAAECRSPLILMDAGGVARNVAVHPDENGYCVIGVAAGRTDDGPHYKTLGEMPLPLGPPMPLGEPSYMISGRPKLQDGDPELTATKGDIDAINKRLDHLEDLIRCLGPEVHAADDGTTQRPRVYYGAATVPCP
jgi:hypothetical protein